MQSTSGGGISSSGGGGGGGNSSGGGGGLARFRSAPATWLEELLEDEEEDPLKPNQCLTQLLAGNSVTLSSPASQGLFDAGPSAGFARQNSSPAEFLGSSGIDSEGFYSAYGISAKYELPSPSLEISPTSKRGREVENHNFPPKFSPSQLKRELSCGVSSLIDMDMEKLLEDSVPCRVRAKRGCATHPRSIAERVRRTKISDRIRKLQEVVPNMDKAVKLTDETIIKGMKAKWHSKTLQTNTADMLDEAVEYVKFLQRQIQELTEHQRRCKCMEKD